MENTAIKIEGLGKRYTLGNNEPYLSLRDKLAGVFKKRSGSSKDFWALEDINLEIKKGDTIGIIGRNGAGKSTLLKVLSQITPPTKGKISINGRVASLLEVGTGFHPELTGRENIYLNGAILGMTRKEIKKKFDEIVAFSEIEKFLDTPVKRYSSGMYVRLAFAVAAHLEPEILIVDEVLAVGDAQFQKKCLGKMKDISGKGRTVIFVSHNMAAISSLCEKAVLLEKGKKVKEGPTRKVIDYYMANREIEDSGIADLISNSLRRNSLENSKMKYRQVTVFNSAGEPSNSILLGEPFKIAVELEAEEDVKDIEVGLSVDTIYNVSVTNTFQADYNLPREYSKGKTIFSIDFPENFFSPDNYVIGLSVRGSEVLDWIPEAINIQILDIPWKDNAKIIPWKNYHSGCVRYPCGWSFENGKR